MKGSQLGMLHVWGIPGVEEDLAFHPPMFACSKGGQRILPGEQLLGWVGDLCCLFLGTNEERSQEGTAACGG
jgi:hypothetical protein